MNVACDENIVQIKLLFFCHYTYPDVSIYRLLAMGRKD